MDRLCQQRLGRLAAFDPPEYDRAVPPSIVHVGVGAFARAHLCVYADDLLRRGHPSAVHGVSLRSDRARAELAPQDGLFTVLEREPDAPTAPRVVGSLTGVETGATAAIDAIARDGTRMVTMTVTEKGYEVHGADPSRTTAVGVLVAGLAHRRGRDGAGLVVASLDNLADNGHVLRDATISLAEAQDPDLARWITDEVRFPRSVVDRMVPAVADADVDEVAALLGMTDLAAVVAEHHRSWAIDRVDGLGPLDEVGVEVVEDIGAHQIRKLWLLNGPHSALAYIGLSVGCTTIAQAAAHPVAAPFVSALVQDVLEVAPGGGPTATFAHESLRRFRNPALGHTCAQVGADGSRKLPQRLWPVVQLRRSRGLDTRRAALVVAAWLAQIERLEDPDRQRVLDAPSDAARVEVVAGSTDAGFRAEVSAMLERVRALGPAAFGPVP